MNITEYQIETGRTRPDLGSLEKNLLHMKLGVYTEIAEIVDIIKKNMAYDKPLDKVHIGEEVADACWYIANEARLRGMTLKNEYLEIHYSKLGPITDVSEVIGTCEDIFGSYIGAFPGDFINTPHMKLALLRQVAEFYDLDFYQILENNINKLRVRFPEKFEGSLAINKDVAAERVELEK